MADIFTSSSAYHGTFVAGTVETDPTFQICAAGDINASNMFEASFWLNRNGVRQDSNLGNASYRIRDKDGALVSGMTEASIAPDVNGYFQITPVSAALIFDLTHYLLEIEIPYDGVEKSGTIALQIGD